jgi:hypothetical protein
MSRKLEEGVCMIFNKQIFALSLLLLASNANAGKTSKQPVRDIASDVLTEQVVPVKKEPLRNIARESAKGRSLNKQEQAVFLEEDIDETANKTGMIRYTITIFKDQDRYSMGDWDDATRGAVRKFRNMSSQHGDWIDEVVDDIRTSLNKAFDPNAPRSGIHAEVKVQMSSGERPSDCRCGDKCACAAHYAGNCPCSLETVKAYPAEVRVCCLDRKR